MFFYSDTVLIYFFHAHTKCLELSSNKSLNASMEEIVRHIFHVCYIKNFEDFISIHKSTGQFFRKKLIRVHILILKFDDKIRITFYCSMLYCIHASYVYFEKKQNGCLVLDQPVDFQVDCVCACFLVFCGETMLKF